MKKPTQLLANLVLYGVLIYYAVDSTFVEFDPWFAFVVWFLLIVAAVISTVPGLRAKSVSPGEYPSDE
ncbi:MAG: hypothetical protein NTV05_02670 [Acidobacteria bacterium]|nr:hypothetical protein [Acidobacteriota bacterium]